ncbi:MAG: DeoR/GlpR family DNA-binding transcription regulator [Treponema sp.]|jgi:DeoR family deoxyribose operon repressor|nr:DeoR/GlpR family DNA-binding transcription regulator [Treponema sp.]
MANIGKRIQEEIDIITGSHFITVSQLARELDVSEMTVRRDLRGLADENKVKLVYGGVVSTSVGTNQNGYTLTKEQDKNTEQKLAIVKQAIQLLEPNDVIFLDSGTTVQLFAELIPQDYANTIICPSLNTIKVLVQLPHCTVIIPGGVYSPKPAVFYDSDSTMALRKYRASKAFIGTTGFDLNLGLTCGYVEDAPLKQAMIESSKDRILLTDSAKFGQVSACLFGNITEFSMVITDAGIPDEYAQHIRNAGVQLILV